MEEDNRCWKREMKTPEPGRHHGAALLGTSVILISQNKQGIRIPPRPDVVGSLFETGSLVEILPPKSRGPGFMKAQFSCQPSDQIVDGPQLSMTLDQNIALTQVSPERSPVIRT
jgi:hypothetical protein